MIRIKNKNKLPPVQGIGFIAAFIFITTLCLFAQASATDDPFYLKRATREATLITSRQGIIRQFGSIEQSPWKMIGPFDNADGKGHQKVYPPEKEIQFTATYTGAEGQEVKWQDVGRFKDGEVQTLNIFPQNEYILCYLYRTIEVDRDMPATLFLGSDDSLKVWLNGQILHEFGAQRTMPDKKDEVQVQLHRGVNTLLLKVGNLISAYAFYFQLSTASTDAQARIQARVDVEFPNGEPRFYRLETIPVPREIILEVGGMAFTPNGTLMICTRRGEIWAKQENQWHLFASGLEEPLGIWPGKPGEFIVAQKCELTRLEDLDGDGTADLYETITDAWEYSGQMYEFTFGPVRDKEGNLWGALSCWFYPRVSYPRPPYSGWEVAPPLGVAPNPKTAWRGWVFKVTPKGEFVPWATGFRSPNGLGFSPEGELFVCENQGEYFGANPVQHITRGAFFGFPTGLFWDQSVTRDPFSIPLAELDRRRKPPALQLPYGPMGQSITQPLWDLTEGKFGPFSGQMFVGDQTKCTIMRCVLEKVDGEYQGVAFPFRAGFQCGNNRLAFAPDGSLYVGQTDRGWGSIGGRPYGLQRLVWTGEVPMEIQTMKLTSNGFDLVFTKPVDPRTARDPAAYSFEHFHYHYHRFYGSPQVANTPVPVQSVNMAEDRRRVSLVLPELVTKKIYELHIRGLKAEDGMELLHPEAYYTLNRLVNQGKDDSGASGASSRASK